MEKPEMWTLKIPKIETSKITKVVLLNLPKVGNLKILKSEFCKKV